MNKRTVSKLHLNRETLRSLEDSRLKDAAGGRTAPQTGGTNEISICKYCTTPLDSCPDQTGTIA